MSLSPRKSILELVTYKPNFGKSNLKNTIRMSANENPLGCSPKVSESIKDVNFNRYPPQVSEKLIASISKRFNLDQSKIILGNGSDELISIIAQSYLNFGDEAIYTEYGFLQFPQAISVAGGKAVVAKDKNLTVSVDNILKKITPKTSIVFLANPNNPTGTLIDKSEVIRLIESLPKNILLVYDAAYAEYICDSAYTDGISLVKKYKNVIMLRTFSKLHGLAGLRLGWGYCSESIINTLMSVRGPFSVNTVAIKAGIAAIEDKDFQKKSFNFNKKYMKWFEKELKKLNILYQKSATNFILIKFPILKNKDAKTAEVFLSKEGILVRSMKPYNLEEYIRVSLGTAEENKIFINRLKKFLEI